MLKLERFEHSQTGEFNDFRKKHAPRNSDKSGGIIINESGLYVFYEEGEPLDVVEQEAWLIEQVRSKKQEVLQAEPALRQIKAENGQLETDLADRQSELAGLSDTKKNDRDKVKEINGEITQIQARITMNAQFIFMTEANRQKAQATIAAIRSVLEDIKSKSFVI